MLKSNKVSVTTSITYLDVVNGSGVGFDDPAEGAQRQTTFNDAVEYVLSNFVNTGNLDIEVALSETDGNGFLATGGAVFFAQTGFQSSFAFQHINTGVDPFPGIPDITVTVDFGHNWNIGLGSPAVDESDLFSVIVHEITHGLGFTSLLGENGASAVGSAFSTFDQLLQQSPNNNLFSSTGNFILTANDLVKNDIVFNGTNAQTNLGEKPPIRSPAPFSDGSSLSHWNKTDIEALGKTAVMTESITNGTTARTFEAFEIQAFRDLGYALTGTSNTAPIISSISTQTINEDQSSSAIAFTVSDAESSSSNLTLSATSSNQGVISNSGITLSGSGANRSITLVPIANANGSSQIAINVNDGLVTSTRTFTLTVSPVNDEPNISGSPTNIIAVDENYNFAPIISDIDGDNLSVSIENKPNWMIINNQSGLLSGVPQNTDIGVYSNVVLTVSDGNLTSSLSPFSITVTGNSSPTAIADNYNVDEGSNLIVNSNLGVLANDSDIDNDNLTVTLVDEPTHALSFNLASDGSFSYQHDGSELLSDTFSYRNTDGDLFSETVLVQINVNSINDQPQVNSTPVTSAIAGQNYSYQLLAIDPDSSSLTFSVITAPSYLIIDNQNRLTGIIPSVQRDDIEVTIQVSDGELTSVQSFTIEVENNTPTTDTVIAIFSATHVTLGGEVNLNISFTPIDSANNILNITLTGSLTASSEDCTANNNIFECVANTTNETSNFTVKIVPSDIGDVIANVASSNKSISADISVIATVVEQSSNDTQILGLNSLNYSSKVLDGIEQGIMVTTLINGQHKFLIYDPISLTLAYSENINAGSPLIFTDVNGDDLADIVGQVDNDIQVRVANDTTFDLTQSITNTTLLGVTESDGKVLMLTKTSTQFLIYQFSSGQFNLLYQEDSIVEDAQLVSLSHAATGETDLLLTRLDEQLNRITAVHFDFIATLANAKNGRHSKTLPDLEFTNGPESNLSFIDIDNDLLMEVMVTNADLQFSKKLLQISSQSDELTLIQTLGNAKVESIHSGDFNGDGKDDLLIHNTNGTIQIYILNTSEQKLTLNNIVYFADNGIVSVADFDKDGTDDVAIYNVNNSNLQQHLQQASSFTETDLTLTTNATGSFEINVAKDFEFTLTNLNNDTSRNVVLDIVLPELLTLNSLSAVSSNDACIITGLQIACEELPGSSSLSFILALTANDTGTGSLTLKVSSETQDSDLTNNQIQLTISANNTPSPPNTPTTSDSSNGGGGSINWGYTLLLLCLLLRKRLSNTSHNNKRQA
jgi:hypothetical protein